MRELTERAPKMIDRLNDADREHFDAVLGLLDAAGIEYAIDPRLVRGLDYYTRTVFEFRLEELGAQSGIGGGGRYDLLVEQLGGQPTPAAGWATGLERIAEAVRLRGIDRAGAGGTERTPRSRRPPGPDVVFVLTEPAARARSFGIAAALRRQGVGATFDLGGRSLKGQMKQADRLRAGWVVIVGPDEWSRGVATLRDMRTQEQGEVSLEQLPPRLAASVREDAHR